MQKLITKYGLAAHLAVLAVAPLFLSPAAVLWLAAFTAVWIVIEPSRVSGEMLHDARKRVAWKIMHDPVFWVMLAITVFALVRSLNGGVGLAYDAENGVWYVSQPHVQILPGVVSGKGVAEASAAFALLVVLQGVRHALGRSARGAFALVVAFLSGVAAIILFICRLNAMDCRVDCGTVFGVCLVLSVVALSDIFENGWIKTLPMIFVAICGNAVGLFAFASPLFAGVLAVITLVVFAYAFAYVRLKLGNPTEFRFMVLFALPLAAAYAAVTQFMPSDELQARIAPYLSGAWFSDDFFNLRSCLGEISFKIWKSHPWIGTGIGSYKTALGYFAEPSVWETVPPAQADPMNGYWMLLVERGTIGAFVIVTMLCLLVWTYVKRMIAGIKAARLPSCAVLAGVLVVVVVLSEMVVDCVALMPGLLVIVAATLSLSASSFPREKEKNV